MGVGPASFGQPIRSRSSILDDVQLLGDFSTVRSVIDGPGAHYFVKGNGAIGIQLPVITGSNQTRSVSPARYSWAFEQQIENEEETRLYDRLAAGGRVVRFVPYDLVTEEFVLSAGANSFTLARSEATIVAGFLGAPNHPHKAWIEGVEKTVVTGSPSSGEVQVNGLGVALTGATAGERLEVRYYPAYEVVCLLDEWRFSDDRDQVRDVQLIEAGV